MSQSVWGNRRSREKDSTLKLPKTLSYPTQRHWDDLRPLLSIIPTLSIIRTFSSIWVCQQRCQVRQVWLCNTLNQLSGNFLYNEDENQKNQRWRWWSTQGCPVGVFCLLGDHVLGKLIILDFIALFHFNAVLERKLAPICSSSSSASLCMPILARLKGFGAKWDLRGSRPISSIWGVGSEICTLSMLLKKISTVTDYTTETRRQTDDWCEEREALLKRTWELELPVGRTV